MFKVTWYDALLGIAFTCGIAAALLFLVCLALDNMAMCLSTGLFMCIFWFCLFAAWSVGVKMSKGQKVFPYTDANLLAIRKQSPADSLIWVEVMQARNRDHWQMYLQESKVRHTEGQNYGKF